MLATETRGPSIPSADASVGADQVSVIDAEEARALPTFDRDEAAWEAAQGRAESGTEEQDEYSSNTDPEANPNDPAAHESSSTQVAEVTADPNSAIEQALSRIEEQQQKFNEDVVDKADKFAAGADRQVASLEGQLKELNDENWIVRSANRVSGVTGEVETQIEQEKASSQERHEHADKMREAAEESKNKAAEARALLDRAKESEAKGDTTTAATQREEAAKLAEQAHAAISGDDKSSMNIVNETRRLQELRDSSQRLGQSIAGLDTAITGLEYVDKGAKTAAVAAGTVVAGPMGAAAASAMYDEAKAVGTLASEVSMGEKTLAEAGEELAGKQLDIAVDAALSAGTAYVGGQAGKIVQSAGGGIVKQVAAGAVLGAATSTTGEGIKVGVERAEAEYTFSQQAQGLIGAEREAAHDRFMEQRGVSGEQIAHRLTGAAISGAVTGAVSAGTVKVGKVAQGVANEGADVGAGAAQEYVATGHVTVEGLVIATVASQVGHHVGHAGRPGAHVNSSTPDSTPAQAGVREHSNDQPLHTDQPSSARADGDAVVSVKPAEVAAVRTEEHVIADAKPLEQPSPTQATAPREAEPTRTWQANPENKAPTGTVPESPVALVELPLDHADVHVDLSKLPPGVNPDSIVVVDPKTVRTSQTGVTEKTTTEIVGKMEENGYVAEGSRTAIDNAANIVQMPDGAYTSMDNKRIIAAEEAGVPVVARKHDYDEPLTRAEGKTFQKQADFVHVPERRQELIDSGNFEVKVKADGRIYLVPNTWGAAVELRVATASEPNFVKNKPYGSIEERPERRESK